MGPGFTVPEAKMYEHLKAHHITPVALCPKNEEKKGKQLDMELRTFWLFGQINKVPLLRQAIQYFFPLNFYFMGLKKGTKDLDLIHSVETFNIYTYQALRSGKPVVLTVWENILFNNEQRFYKRIKELAIKNTKKFIAVTEKSKQVLLLEGVDENRIVVIPAGIDPDHFKPKKKNRQFMVKYSLSEAATNVLLMASLIERKGVIDAVHAIAALRKKGHNVNLLIAGKGPLKKKITALARDLGIAGNIKILDFVPYEETPDIYNLCDIFCLPSRPDYSWTEQFGMVFLEAMACEKPIVSTWSGSIPEIVINNQTGILVSPGDVVALAAALQSLLANEAMRKKLGKQGREIVIKHFSVEHCVQKIASVYKEVMADEKKQ